MKLVSDIPEFLFSPLPGDDLPENEIERSNFARGHLDALETHIERISEALALFDFSNERVDGEAQVRNWTWAMIAVRDAAITIDDFRRSMTWAKMAWEQCPTINSRINHSAVNAVFASFNDRFPHSEFIRNAAAHQSDFFATPNNVKKNAMSHGTAQIAYSSCVSGRIVIYTGYSKVLQFEMSTNTIDKLKGIRTALFRALAARQ